MKPPRYGATLAQGGKSFQYITSVIKYFAKGYMQYDEGENQQKKLLNCSRVFGANGDIKASREIKFLVSANLNTKKLETQIYINRIFSHCIQNLITPKLE